MSFLCNQSKWTVAGQTPQICPKNPYRIYELEDIRAGLRDSIDPMTQASLGLCGTAQYLDGGSPTSTLGLYFCGIVVLRDCVLNVTAGNTNEINGAGADLNLAPLSGATLPAGTILLGNFKKVVLVSGHVKLMPHPFL